MIDTEKLKALQELQSLPLELKVQKSIAKIMEFYREFDGEVYITFSGGKDSTVLLDLVRSIYPDVPALFYNTGVEYPQIVEFVKTKENVVMLRPEKSFRKCIEEYGYPVISKRVSRALRVAYNSPNGKVATKLKGYLENPLETKGTRFDKWAFMLNAPFKISDRCCEILKKNPSNKYLKSIGFKGGIYIGTLAEESNSRKWGWVQTGCNDFKNKKSKPLSFWTEQDILTYIKYKKLDYALVYGDIIEENGKLKTTGEDRTGCLFCLFCPIQKYFTGFQRFENLKLINPKLYDYAMRDWNKGGLGYRQVIDWIKENYLKYFKQVAKKKDYYDKYLDKGLD